MWGLLVAMAVSCTGFLSSFKESCEIGGFCASINHLRLVVFILLHRIIWDWQDRTDAWQIHPNNRFSWQCLPKVTILAPNTHHLNTCHLLDCYLWTSFNIGLASKLPAGCSLRMASLGGWCYHLSQAQMPWAASRLACQALGGQLSSITSSEEDLVVAELAREAKSAVWTGGCQESSRAGWKWEDGSRWRFTRWPSCEEHTRCTWGEPGERGCLVVSQSGWQVKSMMAPDWCSFHLDYVSTILGCHLDDTRPAGWRSVRAAKVCVQDQGEDGGWVSTHKKMLSHFQFLFDNIMTWHGPDMNSDHAMVCHEWTVWLCIKVFHISFLLSYFHLINHPLSERALFYLLGLGSGLLLCIVFFLDVICCCCCWRRRRRREAHRPHFATAKLIFLQQIQKT